MSTFTDLEKDAASVDGFVNNNGLIVTRRNGPKPSWQYIVDQVYGQLGYAVAGSFVDGFTYTNIRQVGVDASGNTWIYTGGQQNIPHIVEAGTTPSEPEYFQVSVNSADNVILDNGENLQQAIDRLNVETEDVPELIKSILISFGLSGNYGFFVDGFAYEYEGDIGIDSNGDIWTYNGELPFEVEEGTTPSEPDYNLIKFNEAANINTDSNGTVQDFINQKNSEWDFNFVGWGFGGGRVISSEQTHYINPEITTVDSVMVTGGRGVIDDNNQGVQPNGDLRLKNSYNQMIGYVRGEPTDIGGVSYDNWTPAQDVNPSVNPELCQVIGGGDNSCNGLAIQMVGVLHCDTSVWGNHTFMYGGTYNKAGGFYSSTIGGTNNNNFGNRSIIASSYNCRIGNDGSDLSSAITNASLTRHSKIISSAMCTTDVSHSQPDGHGSSTTKDFSKAFGFGASSEVYGGFARSSAPFRIRGDNQVEDIILARTTSTGIATNLLATTDWVFTSGATTQEKINAGGSITIGADTYMLVKGEVIAKQTNGSGVHVVEFKAFVSREGTANASVDFKEETVIFSNRSSGNASTDYVVDASIVNGSTLSITGKGLVGEDVKWQFEGSLQRIRDISTGTAITPPIPFDVQ